MNILDLKVIGLALQLIFIHAWVLQFLYPEDSILLQVLKE